MSPQCCGQTTASQSTLRHFCLPKAALHSVTKAQVALNTTRNPLFFLLFSYKPSRCILQPFLHRRGLSDSLGITWGHSLPLWGRGQKSLPKQTLSSVFFPSLHLTESPSGASFGACGYPFHAPFNTLKLFFLLWTSGQTLIHHTRGHGPSTSSPA